MRIVSAIAVLLLLPGALWAEDPHAAFSKLPSHLDRVRVGDWGRYKVTIEQSNALPQSVSLTIRISAVSELRCSLRISRKLQGSETLVTSANHLPRHETWRALWEAMLRQKGMNVRLTASRVRQDTIQLMGRKLACRKVTLDYQGTCQIHGQAIPLRAHSVYWLSSECPIQGIGMSLTRFTLTQGKRSLSYQVKLTLQQLGHRPPKK